MVETYELEVERHPEACEESKRLIEELGLAGQGATITEDKGRLPYRMMTATESEVFGLLLPVREKIETYCADSIPLRVLQILAHAKSLGCFGGFEIMHQAAQVKDPVLCAYMPGEQYSYHKRYLLARWGDALDEMPALIRAAAKVKVQLATDACRKAIAQATALLAVCESSEPSLSINVPSWFGG